jgi:hypothetical protein
VHYISCATALESLAGIGSQITYWLNATITEATSGNYCGVTNEISCGCTTAYGCSQCLGGLKSTASTPLIHYILFLGEFSLCFSGALSTAEVIGQRRRYDGFGGRTERMWQRAVFKLPVRHFT